MFTCPNCQQPLTRQTTGFGVLWICTTCQGRAVSFELLRKTVARDFMNRLWQTARTNPDGAGKTCPACEMQMAQVSSDGVTCAVTLDVCTHCHFLWFDARESEELPIVPMPPPDAPLLSAKAREIIALQKVEALAEQARASDNDRPEEWWQVVAGFCGVPVEEGAPPLSQWPLVTWAVAALIAIVSIVAFRDLENVVAQFGLIPAQAGRWHGLTYLTSFFLHGGVLHLAGNLYFFLIFGDNVEDYLGKIRFPLLLLLATLAGDAAHVLMNPQSTIPCIGASGGISGVLAFYALKFPNVKLTFLFRAFFMFRWVRISSRAALALWIGLQILGAVQQAYGFSNVSAAAHLGGVLIGVIFWGAEKI